MRPIYLRSLLVALVLVFGVNAGFSQLDPAFGIGGRIQRELPGTQVHVKGMLLPDGKILVLTGAVAQSQTNYVLVRFNSDGTLDTSYGANGELVLQIPFVSTNARSVRDILLQPDGKPVVVGTDNDGLVARFNPDGTVDTTFSGDGVDRPNIDPSGRDDVYAVQLQADGKILAIGESNTGTFLIRYNTDGTLDSTYGNQSGLIVHQLGSANVMTVASQSDGRPLIMPGSSGVDSDRQVYRINLDGSLDNTFTAPTLSIAQAHRALLVTSDDKIIIADSPRFTDQYLRAQADLRLRRLNANGTLDTTFGNAGSLVVDVSHLMPDYFLGAVAKPDGSFIIATQTSVEPNRTSVKGGYIGLLHFNAAGTMLGRSLAVQRNAAIAVIGSAFLTLQPDGKLLVLTTLPVENDPQNFFDVMMTRHIGFPTVDYKFRAVPFDFSVGTASGRTIPSVFRLTGSTRYLHVGGITVNNFGLAGDIHVHSDYTRGFATDLAAFRPSTGTWYISRNDYYAAQNNFIVIQWGLNGDVPVPYDYDGDGKSDVAVFRPSDGNWYIHLLSDGSSRIVHWGLNGDKPVAGDFDGDGVGDLAVWRPSTGVWYILRSSDGQVAIGAFGLDGDIPVQEDYDGDGKTDIAVWRPSTGVWYIWRSSDGGYSILQYGLSDDVPTPGDYDGDSKIDISVWRSGTWYQYRSTTDSSSQFPYGLPGDIPLPGRY